MNDDFSLSNTKVKEWAQSALTEIVQLYKDDGSDMHVSCDNGRQTGVLPVPKSKDGDSFVAMDVHDNPDPAIIAAAGRMHEKGLITSADGGALTDSGRQAVEHLEQLLSLLDPPS